MSVRTDYAATLRDLERRVTVSRRKTDVRDGIVIGACLCVGYGAGLVCGIGLALWALGWAPGW